MDGWKTARRARIEYELREAIALADAPEHLRAAMEYALFGGGKRLRPLLCVGAAEAAGGTPEEAVAAAAAVEIVHTYSLIHDDLPCMDDDDFRRGRPSCHRAFDEATALLAGDALLALAFEVAAQRTQDAGRAVRIVAELARASGPAGMVGGQTLDLAAKESRLTVEELERVHALKTGALIEASVRTGAIAAGADDEVLAALTAYARPFGLAFQIADDVLDVSAGSDLGKSTFPALLGLEASRARARALADEAIAALGRFGGAADPLRHLANLAVERDR